MGAFFSIFSGFSFDFDFHEIPNRSCLILSRIELLGIRRAQFISLCSEFVDLLMLNWKFLVFTVLFETRDLKLLDYNITLSSIVFIPKLKVFIFQLLISDLNWVFYYRDLRFIATKCQCHCNVASLEYEFLIAVMI